jgi:SAM-dependent methyltransferase
MQTAAQTCEWLDYIVPDFSFAEYAPGQRVLDVGFGTGDQMRRLRATGCRAFGIEYDAQLAARGRSEGLDVCRAAAEDLPFATGSLDGLLCKVVIPYTDEAKAVAEIARVLRPGALARVSYHGLGYSLRYLFTDPNWKRRVYAARVIVNTIVYRLTGTRLPGFWGDTVYQSQSRLRSYYTRVGLDLVEDHPSPAFAGAPVFIYHQLRRRAH